MLTKILRTAVPLLAAFATFASAAPAPTPYQPAHVIADNPNDVVLRADFPGGNAKTVVGIIQFYSLNGTTKVHVDVTGLPKNSGMFSYHIHEKPVHGEEACEVSGGHFNPYGASADCEAMGDDSLCEIGDLSGKHGLINTTCFELFYHDPYLSLNPASPQYIGGKAINIHLDNGERLACATIHPSREPEDLKLLDVETEAEEVKQFEILAGIIPATPIQASAVVTDDVAPVAAPMPEPEAPAEEATPDEVLEETAPDSDMDAEEDVEEDDLDDLIFEDIEDENKAISNTTEVVSNTTSNVSNISNVSGSGDEENKAASLNSGVLLSVIIGAAVAFMW